MSSCELTERVGAASRQSDSPVSQPCLARHDKVVSTLEQGCSIKGFDFFFLSLRMCCVSRSLGFARSHCSRTHKEEKLSQRAPYCYVWLAFTESNFLNLFVDHRGPRVCAEPCTHSRFSYEKAQNNKKTCKSLKFGFTRTQMCRFPFDDY